MFYLNARFLDQEDNQYDTMGIIENDEQANAVDCFLDKVFSKLPESFVIFDYKFNKSTEDNGDVYYFCRNFHVRSKNDFFKSKAKTAKNCSIFLSEEEV